MSLEQRLTSLIRAGRHVIDSDFDVMAYHEWRREADECMHVLLGPEKGTTSLLECRGTRDECRRSQV